jgi:hypothetical protein
MHKISSTLPKHLWEPTECLGIQILTIKLLLVISIVFGFFGTPCSDMTISNSTVVRLEGILNSQGPKIFCA